MFAMTYLDFEIEIGLGAGREYPVAIVRSPAGEAREMMKFPFDELALKDRLQNLQIALLRSGGKRRSFLSPEEQTVQEFGQALFNALLTGEVRSRYDVSQREAAQKGLGLRFKLRIQSPELAALPWEFLYDSRQAEYVCLSRSTPVVRYLELPQTIQPLAVTPPLRILGMMVSPSDLQPLDLENEKHRVEEATKDLQKKGLVELTWLEGKTWRDLQKAMRGGPWHIFHFIGHGAFDRNAGEGLIFLEDEDGASYRLSATQLGRLLADHPSLRLALLNACEGARGSARDIFSSTGSILVRRGLPAVLAMQYEITDRAAVEFSRSFYEALAESMPVDAAVVEARKAISLAVNNTVEWGTPVLYMRAPDGKVFDIVRQRQPVKPERMQAQPTPAPPRVEKERKTVAPVAPLPEIKPRRSHQRPIMISAIALGLIVLTYLVVRNWPVSPEGPVSTKKTAQSMSDSLYLKFKNAGDASFNRKDFANAKRHYQEALKQRPGDKYAVARLDTCEQKITVQADLAERLKQYNQYKSEADTYFSQGKYESAKLRYNDALGQKPGDTYVINQIHECEKRIATAEEETKRDKSYAQLRDEGDAAFKQGDFAKAKSKYEQARSYKTGDRYATDRIQECNDKLLAARQPKEDMTPAGMVRIPAGSFMMGSNDGESDEKPVHQVSVDEFYMDKYEMTVAQYQKFLAANSSQTKPDNWNEQLQNSNWPVVYVTWNDAVAYCEWLSRQRGKRVRLPTEAEWEYAARGGLSGKKYPWGDDISAAKANYDASGNRQLDWENAKRYLRDVGSYAANNYGLYDTAGNVWEWCSDWYSSDYYQASPSRNPKGPTSGTSRVLRGGSWDNYPHNLRCAYRNGDEPTFRYNSVGVRCAQDVR